MNRHPRIAILSVVLLMAMTVSGLFPQSALADDVPPPPPDTGEPAPTEPPPSEESTEPPPTEEPTEVPPVEPVPDGSSEEPAPSEVVDALPPDTELVVLDANGEALSLSTTEAALIVATGDPEWCPAGSGPGDDGCTSGYGTLYNSFNGLLSWLQLNYNTYTGPGTIFVESAYSTIGEGGVILINGLGTYGITDLTIQGGWDFGLNEYSGTPSTFNEALQIINWDYDITLNDLIFSGNSTGETENLLVQTTGAIALNNVEVENNATGGGARLDNTSGDGDIEVNSSSFHDNLTIGIQALSNTNINLTDVDASYNDASGAVLDNCQAAVTCSATFAGSVYVSYSTFNNNGEDGLDVTSNGYIQTIDITANDNGQSGLLGSGMLLNNSLADDAQSVTVGYLYGSEFNNNLENGLAVRSQGDITVYQVTANDNGAASTFLGAGAFLDNTYGDGDTYVYNYNQYTDAYGEFNGNYADGLDVLSNGNVELWYVRAEGNGNSGNVAPDWGMGTYIDNCNWDGFSCDGTGWVEVNHSELNSNYSDGLYVYSAGQIDLTDVTANDNGNTSPFWGAGAYLDNADGTGGVTISGGEFGSYVSGGNYGDGLDVYSTGNVYLSYVYAYDNGNGGNTDTDFGNGAILDSCLENAGACAGTGSVYVYASEFSGNYADGLAAFSSNNIWLNYYVEANDNGQGLNVGVGSGAMLVNNFTGATGSILLYGPITLNNNYTNGLVADSNSDIHIAGVDASDNGDFGAAVTTTNGSVTIDPSTFNSNTDDGLLVSATDNVALTGVGASDNGGFGAAVVTTAGSVSIDQGIFNSNTLFGVDVSAADDVGLSDLEASDNGSFGASIVTSAGGITLDSGAFNSNVGYGLSLSAPDDIDLADVQASDNGSFGASLITSNGAAVVTGGDFNSNTGFGLTASAVDDISLSDVAASDNDSFGASVITSAGAISIDAGIFNANTGFGLIAFGVDRITATDVDANDNGAFGASLMSSGAEVFVNHGNFNSNTAFGLSVSAVDEIVLSDVSANDNGAFGAALTTTAGQVWIANGSFNGNTAFGLDVNAVEDVSLANVVASDNGAYGARVITTAGGVSIDQGYFNQNTSYGLLVSAVDDIDLDAVQANDNVAAYGADLHSSAGALRINVSAFNGNGTYGLAGVAPASVNVWNTSASDNSGYGADLAANGNVTLMDSYFSQNSGGAGLSVATTGSTTLDGVTADLNSGTGAIITSTNKTLVEFASFNQNSGAGLSVVSGGAVKLNDVDAFSNTLSGATITTGSNVFVSPSYFNWNGANGLDIIAGGSVMLAEVNASNNTGAGVNVSANGTITVDGGFFSGNGGDGLNLISGSDIIIKCVTALNNGGYGIDANLPGTLNTYGNVLANNSSGDVNVAGGGDWKQLEKECGGWPHWSTSGLPWQVFHVTTGDTYTLECTLFGGTVLILPSWDHVDIPCPITGDASLVAVLGDNLPGPLGENYTFVSGLDAQITPAFDGDITIDFLIPPAYAGTNLIIMHWDGTQWVDRGGVETSDNFFEITSREAGVFVLVSQ